jgi:hypothetical protein
MATRTYARLVLNSGSTYTQPAGDTIIVTSYVSGDFDGASIISDTPGSPFYLQMPAGGVTVIGCMFADCDASGGGAIDDTAAGGHNGGRNTNITFPTAAKSTGRRSLSLSLALSV